MKASAINPLTRKRLRRFVHHRRAFVSFLILLAIYILALFAELLCNGKPLVVWGNGHVYFPFLAYYSEDSFLGNGISTAPDYGKLKKKGKSLGKRFRIIWAPCRYSPNDIIGEEELSSSLRMYCRVEPVLHTAVFTIDKNMKIIKAQNATVLLPEGSKPGNFSEIWALPEETANALALRFANKAAPSVKTQAKGANATIAEAELSLPEYKPRASAPKSVRITVRSKAGSIASGKWLIKHAKPPETLQIPEIDLNDIIHQLLKDAMQGNGIASREIKTSAGDAILSLEREVVRFPFRPVKGHWLGIDDAGRDVFARLVYAIRTSITFGLALVLSSMVVGTLVGLGQGYFGGWTDLTCQRLIEIWSALPFLYVIILLGSIYGPGFMLLLFCNAIFNWIGISYYMRAEMLRLKRQPFVDAARCLGLPTHRIILRHILPNGLVPIITFFPFSLVGAISSLAALDYLGFGLPLQSPSIGQLLQQAQIQRWAWWLILYPSLTLFSLMLLGVFIGEGIRDAMDPKLSE